MARIVMLTAPKQFTFLVSINPSFALISFLVKIPNVSPLAFWIAIDFYNHTKVATASIPKRVLDYV